MVSDVCFGKDVGTVASLSLRAPSSPDTISQEVQLPAAVVVSVITAVQDYAKVGENRRCGWVLRVSMLLIVRWCSCW